MDRTEERKIKARERAKLWAAKNRERYAANQARWRAENKEKLRDYSIEYRGQKGAEINAKRRQKRKENPELFREKQRKARQKPERRKKATEDSRKWRAENPERYRDQMRKYRKENKEKLLNLGREWRKKNPEKHRAIHTAAAHARRGRTMKVGPMSRADARDVRAAGVCAVCGHPHSKMEVDHIVPLSKGGTNHRSNLQLLCQPCNRSKHDKDQTAWLAIRVTAPKNFSLLDGKTSRRARW